MTVLQVHVQERIRWLEQERPARVRVCNYVKFETGQNLPPVLKIATCIGRAAHVDQAIAAKHMHSHLFYFLFS